MAEPVIITRMKKLLLSVLAVAAVAIVAVVIVENTPERRMDRRINKLLRTYDNPERLYLQLVDDGDLVGLLVLPEHELGNYWSFSASDRDYEIYLIRKKFLRRLARDACDCDTITNQFRPGKGPEISKDYSHAEACRYRKAWQDVRKRWWKYIERKKKKIRDKTLAKMPREG